METLVLVTNKLKCWKTESCELDGLTAVWKLYMTSISQWGIWYTFNSLWFHSMYLWQKTSLLVSEKGDFVCSCIASFLLIMLLRWKPRVHFHFSLWPKSILCRALIFLFTLASSDHSDSPLWLLILSRSQRAMWIFPSLMSREVHICNVVVADDMLLLLKSMSSSSSHRQNHHHHHHLHCQHKYHLTGGERK